MRRVDVALALLASSGALVGFVACSSNQSHPQMELGCPADAQCTVPPPIGGGGPTTDGGVDALSDADAGEVGQELPVSGEIRQPQSFAAVIASAPLATANVDLVAPRFDGSQVELVPAGGTFSFPAVARGSDGNWLLVRRTNLGNAVRTLAWIDTSGAALLGQELPLWPDELTQATATMMGVPGATAGTATVVIRTVDASGNPVAGVTTTRRNYVDTTLGFFGPYFDDGGDQLTYATNATGARGTLVYLQITSTIAFDVPLHFATGDRVVGVELSQDAVSYRVVPAP